MALLNEPTALCSSALRSRQKTRTARRLSADELFDQVLRTRLLPLISRELPELEDYIWLRSENGPNSSSTLRKRTPPTKLNLLPYRFSEDEPAVNRYAAGGSFHQHADHEALTVNVLLRANTFEGGGTAFWQEDPAMVGTRAPGDKPISGPPSVVIQPDEGVGVIFNGTVRHAGLAVTSGLRYVLVASFSIADDE